MKTFNVTWYHGKEKVGSAVVEDSQVEVRVKDLRGNLPVNGRIYVKRLT